MKTKLTLQIDGNTVSWENDFMDNSLEELYNAFEGLLVTHTFTQEQIRKFLIEKSEELNEIYFKNDNNFVIFYCDEKLKSETWLSDCYLCHKTTNDFLIKCDNNECKNYSHMKCLITKKLIQSRDNKFFFYFDYHRNNINKV